MLIWKFSISTINLKINRVKESKFWSAFVKPAHLWAPPFPLAKLPQCHLGSEATLPEAQKSHMAQIISEVKFWWFSFFYEKAFGKITWSFNTSSPSGIRAPCLQDDNLLFLKLFSICGVWTFVVKSFNLNLEIFSTKPGHVVKKDRGTSLQLYGAEMISF